MRKLFITLLVLVVLAVGLDRVAAVVASHVLADAAAKNQDECDKPGVDITGFPFLTQAFGGTYKDVKLVSSCNALGGRFFSPVSVSLIGVHVPFGSVIKGSVNRVPVDRATATATIPFGVLDRRLGLSSHLRFSQGPNRTIEVTAQVTIAGHTLAVHGDAQVTLSTGSLDFSIGDLHTADGTAPGASLTVPPLSLPDLPFDLKSVNAAASSLGIVILATASNLVLSS